MGHFTIIFAPKLITLLFQFATSYQDAFDIQNSLLCRYIYCSSTICLKEYLVTFKLMMSQALQRARPLRTCTLHSVLGWLCSPYSQLESGSLLDRVFKILWTKQQYETYLQLTSRIARYVWL